MGKISFLMLEIEEKAKLKFLLGNENGYKKSAKIVEKLDEVSL